MTSDEQIFSVWRAAKSGKFDDAGLASALAAMREAGWVTGLFVLRYGALSAEARRRLWVDGRVLDLTLRRVLVLRAAGGYVLAAASRASADVKEVAAVAAERLTDFALWPFRVVGAVALVGAVVVVGGVAVLFATRRS